MAIQRTGPAKYRFQDTVAVWLALSVKSSKVLHVWNDPDGPKEDITVVLDKDGVNFECEVQVKGSEQDVTLAFVVECLMHFGDKQANECLFDKLLKGKKIVLIASGRCEDAVRSFIAPFSGDVFDYKVKLPRSACKNVRGEIEKWCNLKVETKLAVARKEHCLSFVDLSLDEIYAALHNFCVVESVSEEYLKTRCYEEIISKYGVPFDNRKRILDELVIHARKTVEDETDLVPILDKLLQKYSYENCRLPYYVLRGEEGRWIAELAEKNILLLSGESRCGKTQAAYFVLDHYAHEGNLCAKFNDSSMAIEFLHKNIGSSCCVLLEDPLGSRGFVKEPISKETQKLRELCRLSRSGKKVIVCQSRDELLNVFSRDDIEECRLNGSNWHDLSVYTSDFLIRVWEKVCEEACTTQDFSLVVKKLLEKGMVFEPGAMETMAFSPDFLSGDYDAMAVQRMAQQDADDLSYQLKERFGEIIVLVLGTLAAVTFNNDGVSLKDLAFILSDGFDGEILPGKKKDLGRVYGSKTSPVPDYSVDYALNDDVLDLIYDLERRRLVVVGSDLLKFRHPFYRAAGELLLNNAARSSVLNFLGVCSRAIYSASPAVCLSVAKSLGWLNRYLGERFNEDLAELAFEIRGTLYPASLDCSLSYLLDHFELLDKDKRREMLMHPYPYGLSVNDVEWKDGEAWIPEEQGLFKSFENESDVATQSEVENLISSFSDGFGAGLFHWDLLRVLLFYKNNLEELPRELVYCIFECDLGLLRAEAAKMWVSIERIDDEFLLDKIMSDHIPTVISSVYHSIARNWDILSQKRKELLIAKVKASISDSVHAGILLTDLVNSRSNGKDYPLVLFLKLIPDTLLNANYMVPINAARFHAIMLQSSKEVCVEMVLPAIDAWISKIDEWLAKGSPGDYKLGVVDALMIATKNDSSLRVGRTEKLLACNVTPVLMMFVSEYIDCWAALEPWERSLIVQLVHSDRTDRYWLQAASLTRDVVPDELQESILGEVCLSDGVDVVLSNLNERLLEACAHVYCGEPYPLSRYGKSHRGKGVWEPVLKNIGRNIDHPLFELVLFEAAYQNDDFWMNEIVTCNAEDADRLFPLLLALKEDFKDSHFSDAWKILLDSSESTEQLDQWLGKISETLPYIAENFRDIANWLTGIDFNSFVRKYFLGDCFCLQLVDVYAQSVGEGTDAQNKVLEGIKVCLKVQPVFWENIKYVQRLAEKYELQESNEYIELKKIKKAAIDKYHLRRNEDSFLKQEIVDWGVGLH